MKKIIVLLMMVIMTIPLFAQASEHLTFKGVPIDGTLKQFYSKLQQEGFDGYVSEEGDMALANGDFAGFKGCLCAIQTSHPEELISEVNILFFPRSETWATLSSNYNSLKSMLTDKYGKPSDCVERFPSLYISKDDNSKMHEVIMDRCTYRTSYEVENGFIILSINNTTVTAQLTYIDRINSETARTKAMDDL
jgi:hypothetical protein